MHAQQLSAIVPGRPFLTTNELAALLGIQPQSIRKRYCKTGAYYTLRPVKGPNGWLFWPADSFEKLTGGR
jgi:hypothetical protein